MQRQFAKQSLQASVKDGLCWSVMMGFTDSYIVPFSIILGANPAQIGFLRSFPLFLGALAQLLLNRLLLLWGSRKRIVLNIILLQSVSLSIAAISGLLPSSAGLPVFMLTSVLYSVFGVMAVPPWASLMGKYLPPDKRGTYLGWRDRLTGSALVFFGLAAGWVLPFFAKPVTGFTLLFLAAAAARFRSLKYIAQMYEQPGPPKAEDKVSFIDFALQIHKDNVALFTFSCSFLLFSVFLAAPFFAVYMIEDLKFSYWQYILVIMAGQFTNYLMAKKWGEMCDRYGSISVMRFAVKMIPVVPLLWCLSVKWQVLFAVELFSGLIWAAYNRAAGNFFYDAVRPSLRTKYMAYVGVATGLAQCAGGVLGGYLIMRLPKWGGHSFITVLIISAALRIVAAVPFMVWIKEVVRRRKISEYFLFEAFGFKEIG